MAHPYSSRVLFLVPFCVAAALAVAAQRPTTIPGAEQGRQMIKSAEKSVDQTRIQPAAPSQPDWEKARTDADRLLEIAQQIHKQVHAGPGQLPAALSGELNEAQKLAKRLRQELRL